MPCELGGAAELDTLTTGTLPAGTTTVTMESHDASVLNEARKRRNRLSAAMSRRRKAQILNQLEDKVVSMDQDSKNMALRVQALVEENERMRRMLLAAHARAVARVGAARAAQALATVETAGGDETGSGAAVANTGTDNPDDAGAGTDDEQRTTPHADIERSRALARAAQAAVQRVKEHKLPDELVRARVRTTPGGGDDGAAASAPVGKAAGGAGVPAATQSMTKRSPQQSPGASGPCVVTNSSSAAAQCIPFAPPPLGASAPPVWDLLGAMSATSQLPFATVANVPACLAAPVLVPRTPVSAPPPAGARQTPSHVAPSAAGERTDSASSRGER